jgi:hypothetical protein
LSNLPALHIEVDVSFEDDLHPVFEVDSPVSVSALPDHAGEVVFAIGEGEVDGCVPLAHIYYPAHTADAVETRCGVGDLVDPVVQVSDRE